MWLCQHANWLPLVQAEPSPILAVVVLTAWPVYLRATGLLPTGPAAVQIVQLVQLVSSRGGCVNGGRRGGAARLGCKTPRSPAGVSAATGILGEVSLGPAGVWATHHTAAAAGPASSWDCHWWLQEAPFITALLRWALAPSGTLLPRARPLGRLLSQAEQGILAPARVGAPLAATPPPPDPPPPPPPPPPLLRSNASLPPPHRIQGREDSGRFGGRYR